MRRSRTTNERASRAHHGRRHRRPRVPRARARAAAARRVVSTSCGSARGAGSRRASCPPNNIPIEWLSIGGLRGKGIVTLLAAPFRLAHCAVAGARRDAPAHRRDRGRGLRRFRHRPRRRGRLADARAARDPRAERHRRLFTNRCLAPLAREVLEAFPNSFHAGIDARVRSAIRCAQEIFARAAAGRALRAAQRRDPHARHRRQPRRHAAQRGRAVRDRAARGLTLSRCATRRASAGIDSARKSYAEAKVRADVAPFIEDMAEAYAWADLVICRAGALTISELAAAGVGAVLVPFPAAVDDHQTTTRSTSSSEGAAVLIADRELTRRASRRRAAAPVRGPRQAARDGRARAPASRSRARPKSWPTVVPERIAAWSAA